MVDKFKSIVSELESEKGPLYLFALLKIDEYTDRWSVLLSATWTSTDEERKDAFRLLIAKMVEKLTPEENNQIARVGVWPVDDHLVGDLLKYQIGAHLSEPIPANGNIIHEAYILASKQPA